MFGKPRSGLRAARCRRRSGRIRGLPAVRSHACCSTARSWLPGNECSTSAPAVASLRWPPSAPALHVDTHHADVCDQPEYAVAFDVVLCSDLNYERSETPRQQRVLAHARGAGADVIVADAGRTYFDAAGLELLAEYEVAVP